MPSAPTILAWAHRILGNNLFRGNFRGPTILKDLPHTIPENYSPYLTYHKMARARARARARGLAHKMIGGAIK